MQLKAGYYPMNEKCELFANQPPEEITGAGTKAKFRAVLFHDEPIILFSKHGIYGVESL